MGTPDEERRQRAVEKRLKAAERCEARGDYERAERWLKRAIDAADGTEMLPPAPPEPSRP